MDKKELVKGYSCYTGEGLEQLFAVCPDDKILTCIRKYSNTFQIKSNQWEETLSLPDEAIYIGKYYL